MLDSRNLTSSSTSMSATKSMYNRFTVAGFSAAPSIGQDSAARTALSGALTANTLVDLINESGSAGEISHFGIKTEDGTARTMRIVVTIDGVVIFDFTSASIAVSGNGCYLAGQQNPSSSIALPPIRYTNSKRIQYASSLTETAKFTTYLAYQDVT